MDDMSVFVAICPKCKRKVGVPRPGSSGGDGNPQAQCPFCDTMVSGKEGFEVAAPVSQQEEFDLLSVE